MGGALMRHNLVSCHNLQALVLGSQIFMLNHDLSNRCLLGEVKLIHSLLEQLRIDSEKSDDDLRADRL